jgi:RecA/RadA recombinase
MAVSEKELMALRIKLENGIKLTRDEKKVIKDNDKEAQEAKKKMTFGQRMLSVSNSEYAQLMGNDEVDKYPIRDWISTGNYLLNAQISGDPFKGMPSGRIWQLAGLNSSGKTFIMLETAKNAQKLGYYFVLFDTEMANNDRDALKKRGIDTEQMLYIPVPTIENLITSVLNILDELAPTDKVIIGIDSIGNISTNKELADSTDGAETKDMTRAAKIKALFRTATLKAGIKNVPIIPINHMYANTSGYGPSKVIGGGEGPAYNASITSEFTKSMIRDTTSKEVTGTGISALASKCRTAKEKTVINFDIDFDEGLTLYSGLFEFCKEEKILLMAKQSYIFAPSLKNEKFYDEVPRSKAKLDGPFWEGFLRSYLADYMRAKFQYQSVTSELMTPEEIEEAGKE